MDRKSRCCACGEETMFPYWEVDWARQICKSCRRGYEINSHSNLVRRHVTPIKAALRLDEEYEEYKKQSQEEGSHEPKH